MLQSSQLSSSSITLNQMSKLHPSVMFPYFHADHLIVDQDGRIANKHIDYSVPTIYNASNLPLFGQSQSYSSASNVEDRDMNQSPYEQSLCLCTPSTSTQATTITIPSFNLHQSVVVPIPASARVLTPTYCPKVHPSKSSMIHTCCHCGRSVCFEPGYVFTSGTTQADTTAPTGLERTHYSWIHLVQTSVLHCSTLYNEDCYSVNQLNNDMQRTIEVHSSVERICPVDLLDRCPGHVGTQVSYKIHIQQWREPINQTKQPQQHKQLYPCCPPQMGDDSSYCSTDSENDD